jgi:hypothetical protein
LLVNRAAIKRILCLSLLAPALLLAREPEEGNGVVPWLTGPLFLVSPRIPPAGHIYVQPYLIFTDQFGTYDQHGHTHSIHHFDTLALIPYIQIGLGHRLEFDIQPQLITHWTQGQSSTHFGDLLTWVDLQVVESQKDCWWPDVKLFVHNHWPTGRFEHLNPRHLGTDSTGDGIIATGLGISLGKVMHIVDYQFLSLGFNATYLFSNSTQVHGLNTYGGGPHTHGRVHVGYDFLVDLALEYEFTRNWAYAMDLIGQWDGPVRFSGHLGQDSSGATATMGGPSSYQLTVAPAIEYNWSESAGFIGGPWWSFAGRNSKQFAGFLLSVALSF